MAVHETNDTVLPDFVCRHPQVIVKFTGKACKLCEELAPDYKDLSGQETYRDIVFLKLDAADNPVASKEVSQHGTPFIVAYRQGCLVGHKLAASRKDIITMLDLLLV